jgi:hypothetical protein
MSTNSKLESYLTTLNDHLSGISVSDRSEIIMEIKSHVMDTLDKNPQKNLEEVLRDFGSAEVIAKKYLEERGIKTLAPKKSTFGTVVKWAMIASAMVMIILSLCLFTLIRGITPLVDITNDKVSILGGFVHITDDEVRVGNTVIGDNPKYSVSGSIDLGTTTKEVKLKGLNGKFKISPSLDKVLSWKCKVDKKSDTLSANKLGTSVELDVTEFHKMNCNVLLPSKLVASATLSNGKIELSDPKGDFDLDLKNGAIEISPSSGVDYNFDLQVQRGVSDDFESSSKEDAIKIKARLENGKISNTAG